MQVQAVGMPWFEEDDYAAFRLLLPTRSWHDTFADWLHAAEQHIEHLKRQRTVAIKANVRSDLFVAWCKERGLDVNSKALAAFANEVAARTLRDDKLN